MVEFVSQTEYSICSAPTIVACGMVVVVSYRILNSLT